MVLPGPGDNNRIEQAAWGANKGFFLVDGTEVPYSMRNKLALDAVMLKMESTMTQEIERVVLPGVHYMPFTMQNVSEVVRYVLAEENAAEMQAMVRRAHTALAEELTLEKGAERMRDDLVRLWAASSYQSAGEVAEANATVAREDEEEAVEPEPEPEPAPEPEPESWVKSRTGCSCSGCSCSCSCS